MKKIQFRQITKADEQAVYDLHIRGLVHSDSLIDDPEARAQLDRDLMQIGSEYLVNRGEFYVALKGDAIVGMGALRKIDDTTAEIKRMRVEPQLQGRGIGSMLLDALIEKASQLGYNKLILDTAINQQAAQRLYQSRGFKEYRRGLEYGQETLYYHLDI